MGYPLAECQRIHDILTANDYEASVAEYATEEFDQAQPDLVILNTLPSNIDSITLIQEIRQKQPVSFVPILLIAPDDSFDLLYSFEEGINDFIELPVEQNHLLNRIQVLLKWKELIDELIWINQQREDFVAYLLHDLRSPLNATNQVLRQLLQGVFGNTLLELQPVLDQLTESNENLIQLVETLLDSYRYETRQQLLNFLPVDLVELTQQVVAQMAPLANQKGLSLALNLETRQGSAPSEIVVLGDRLELYRLLLNLISNSIRYTESGSIEIRLTSSNRIEPSGTGQITLEVEDTGSGIPAEDVETIFERFYRSSSSRRGYGLGLYLARQVVEAHQGSITVRSDEGRGSVFTVRLPAHSDN